MNDLAMIRGQAKLVQYLLLPGLAVITGLVVLPMLWLFYQSFLSHEVGGVGATMQAGLTFQNYIDLLQPAYLRVLFDTFRLSAISAALATGLGLLIAYRVARTRSHSLRRSLLSLLIALMFLSILVRVYAVLLTFGPTGAGNFLLAGIGLQPSSRLYTEVVVILGFLHFLIPVSALMLVGTVQNINPNFFQAATALGAPEWRAHLSSTVPLAVPGLLSTFLVVFSLAASSFIIPLILGRGRVQFLANLTYSRFSEVADYPGGSALAVILLSASLALVGIVSLYKRYGARRPA